MLKWYSVDFSKTGIYRGYNRPIIPSKAGIAPTAPRPRKFIEPCGDKINSECCSQQTDLMLHKMTRKYIWIALLLWIGCCGPAFSQEGAPPNLNVLDSIVQTSIQNHDMPGAVLLVGHNAAK